MTGRSNRLRGLCLAIVLAAPAPMLVGCQPADVGTVGTPREAGADGKAVAPRPNPRAGTDAPAKGGKARPTESSSGR
ncbi:hypothetical protein OJF2_07050 [Aquisphaera giovannonii]|uniref:Lipoprotein n=1 Tax=Aquisphaera giovannonii TaxID=406548 RepID=A0A5B9VUS1_9BACT|nr:hypothetical protein [Aquisphaera giovannonii]QEH32236.1 hypothetical protein OJF2_07050 [Aquisphaera giovannonii]